MLKQYHQYFLYSLLLYSQAMLILILLDAQYLQMLFLALKKVWMQAFLQALFYNR